MTEQHSLYQDAWRRLKRNRAATVSGILLIVLTVACIVVPELSPHRYDQANLSLGPTPPSWSHPMGTDYLGRDLMARVFFGGRISLTVGIVATTVSFVIGVLYGGIAGYFGGRVDNIMMRIVDVLYTFPFLILVILLMVFFAGKDAAPHALWVAVIGLFVDNPTDPVYFPIFQIVFVFAALGAMSWLTMARIVRGQVIALRSRAFIEAAITMGVSHRRIITRHLIPNAVGPIIVYATLTVPQIMLTEAFLSFLGLGTQEPLSSWGLLASSGAEMLSVYPWTLIFPALMLALTLFCFNFLGDGLRDALDPKSQGRGT